MESGQKVPIKKSLVSLKKRVKVFSLKLLALSLQSLVTYTFCQNSLYFALFNQFLCYLTKKKEKQLRRLKAELFELREEMQLKNLKVARFHHEIVQMKELVRSVAKSNSLVNYIVEATVAAWDD